MPSPSLQDPALGVHTRVMMIAQPQPLYRRPHAEPREHNSMQKLNTMASFADFEFQDVIEIVMRRWLWIVLGAIVGLGLGGAAWLVMPRSYAATATILVEPQGVPESYVRSTITLDVAQRINTLQQRVTSNKNLNTLIALIGEQRLDPMAATARAVRAVGSLRSGSCLRVLGPLFTCTNPSGPAGAGDRTPRCFRRR